MSTEQRSGGTLSAQDAVDSNSPGQAGSRFLGSLYARNIRAVFARGLKATWGTNWSIMISGFVEPVL